MRLGERCFPEWKKEKKKIIRRKIFQNIVLSKETVAFMFQSSITGREEGDLLENTCHYQ